MVRKKKNIGRKTFPVNILGIIFVREVRDNKKNRKKLWILNSHQG